MVDRFRVDAAAGLGLRLKLWREARGLSVHEVAQLSGVAPSTLYEWERGAYFPSLGPLVRLLEVLGGTMWVEEGDHDQIG